MMTTFTKEELKHYRKCKGSSSNPFITVFVIFCPIINIFLAIIMTFCFNTVRDKTIDSVKSILEADKHENAWLKAGYTDEQSMILDRDSNINTNDMSEISAEESAKYLTELMKNYMKK